MKKSGYIDSQSAFLWTAWICIVVFMILFMITFEDAIEKDRTQPKHECIQFEKRSVRRMITPMTFRYEDAIVCKECGREYKN